MRAEHLLEALPMKKTLSLLGLLLVGLTLLTNPTTGVVLGAETESDVAASVATMTMSGDPPTGSDDVQGEAIGAGADTTSIPGTTTTTTAAGADGAPSDTFSVVGSAEASRFGTSQVEVFFVDGEIVGVDALQLPTDRRSDAINSAAVPLYTAAVIDAQGADIDAISGATVTWEHYTASLQSAIDEASFGG